MNDTFPQEFLSKPYQPISEVFPRTPPSAVDQVASRRCLYSLPTEYHDTEFYVDVEATPAELPVVGNLTINAYRIVTQPSNINKYVLRETFTVLTGAQINAVGTDGVASGRVTFRGADMIEVYNETDQTLTYLRATIGVLPANVLLNPAPLTRGCTRGK